MANVVKTILTYSFQLITESVSVTVALVITAMGLLASNNHSRLYGVTEIKKKCTIRAEKCNFKYKKLAAHSDLVGMCPLCSP